MLIRGLFMLGLLIWAWKTTAWPVLIALVFLWMQNEALAHLTTGIRQAVAAAREDIHAAVTQALRTHTLLGQLARAMEWSSATATSGTKPEQTALNAECAVAAVREFRLPRRLGSVSVSQTPPRKAGQSGTDTTDGPSARL